METEIKLAVNDISKLTDVSKADWFKQFCLSNKPEACEVLDNTYFDTQDMALRALRGSIRVRKYSTETCYRYEHTVKFGSLCDNGLYQRYEWNVEAKDDRFNLLDFIKTVSQDNDADSVELLKSLFDNVNISSLHPICSTLVERTTYLVKYNDSVIEACFDVGKAIAGNKSSPICELELELVSGKVQDLREMSNYVVEHSELLPSDESKFKKCLNLMESIDE